YRVDSRFDVAVRREDEPEVVQPTGTDGQAFALGQRQELAGRRRGQYYLTDAYGDAVAVDDLVGLVHDFEIEHLAVEGDRAIEIAHVEVQVQKAERAGHDAGSELQGEVQRSRNRVVTIGRDLGEALGPVERAGFGHRRQRIEQHPGVADRAGRV